RAYASVNAGGIRRSLKLKGGRRIEGRNDPPAVRIGVVDTMFARVNMGAIALDELAKLGADVEAERRTVPGIKDLAVECKKLLDSGCDICIALGMVGGAPIDTQCAHEASLGMMQAKLMANKHIIEVFVHENEAWSWRELAEICENRARKHVQNALNLLNHPEELVKMAGKGVRQGKEDEGEIKTRERKMGIGLVVAEFNPGITSEMEKRAMNEAEKSGIDLVEVLHVPGVFDMPLAVKKLLWNKRIDAVVTLGFVKKGETKHDEIVAENASREISGLSLEFKKPVVLGVIGPGATFPQAEARKKEYAERAVQSAVKLVNEMRK
ncbi:MAG: riboflavin synthase, partial [Candidatus Micrarchaeia archaeon]